MIVPADKIGQFVIDLFAFK